MTASLEIVVGPRRLRGWCYAFIDFLKIEKDQGWPSDGFMPRGTSGRAPRPRFPRKIGLLRNGSVLCPAPGLLQNLAKEEPLEAPHGRNVPVHLAKERRPLLRRHEKAGELRSVRLARQDPISDRFPEAVFHVILDLVVHLHDTLADGLVVVGQLRAEVAHDATSARPPILEDIDQSVDITADPIERLLLLIEERPFDQFSDEFVVP